VQAHAGVSVELDAEPEVVVVTEEAVKALNDRLVRGLFALVMIIFSPLNCS
jgi:hypothetical protein